MHSRSTDSDTAEVDDLALPGPTPTTIPGSPILSFGSFFGGRTDIPALTQIEHTALLTSGRMAIAVALRHAGIGPGDEVLIPAYHCTSMVSPVVWTGATPVFFRIHPDTSVDIDDIKQKVSTKSRALLVAHYFGFVQSLDSLRELCDDNDLCLIEDCAHAFFGRAHGQPMGSVGDYAVGSLMKFFPVYDGGCVVSAKRDLSDLDLSSGGVSFELQSALNTVERSFIYKRLMLLWLLLALPLAAKRRIWSWLKSERNEPDGTTSAPAASDGGFDFDPRWVNKRMSLMSRFIGRFASTQRIVDNRRANYIYLQEAFADVPGCRPVHPSLADDVVPYVFPMIVDSLDPAFLNMRRKLAPVLRWEFLWDGVDRDVCPVSFEYSRRLVQIPCHQEYKREELAWMVKVVCEELSHAGGTA